MENMIGKTLPNFSLTDEDGKIWTQENLKGSWTVLYAYPKDMTPGCTIEAHDFTTWLAEFKKLGGQVLGISPDDEKSHQKFCSKEGISYPLLSDPEKKLLSALGCWVEKSMYGKKYMGVERSTWITDPEGTIQKEWRKVSVPGHAKEVLASLSSLM